MELINNAVKQEIPTQNNIRENITETVWVMAQRLAGRIAEAELELSGKMFCQNAVYGMTYDNPVGLKW